VRELATSCSRCGRLLGAASEVLYSVEAEIICQACSGPGALGLDWGSRALARHLAERRAFHRRVQARRRRALGTAIAAAWIAAGVFTAYRVRRLPTVVTIDLLSPASPASPVGGRFVVGGAVVPATVHGRRLWLMVRAPHEPWSPREELALPSAGPGWRKELQIDGVKGARYGVGVVDASAEAIAAFTPARDEIPEWLRTHHPEEQAWRGCRHRSSDAPALPAGTTLLDSIEVVLAEGTEPDPWPCVVGFPTGIRLGMHDTDRPVPRVHHHRRRLGGHTYRAAR